MKTWLYLMSATMAGAAVYNITTVNSFILAVALGLATGCFFQLARREDS